MLPRLKNGCCGCTLYTSSLVISWIRMLSSGLFTLCIGTTGPVAIKYIVEKEMEKGNYVDEGVFDTVFAILMVMLMVSFMIDAFLLYGVYKKNHCTMMPSLIFSGVWIGLNIITSILMFFAVFVEPTTFDGFLSVGIYTGLSCYFWLILFSYYQEIKPQVPVLLPQAPVWSPQAPVWSPQAPVLSHQAPGWPHQAPGWSHQAPGWSPQAPLLVPQAPGFSPQVPQVPPQDHNLSHLYSSKHNNQTGSDM